jgi:diketogulonate reductase-like aldo/keto reductase
MLKNKIKLENQTLMPTIGLGTWMLKHDSDTVQLIKDALKLGYRHLDTAIIYQNEESLQKALNESGIDRDELFITSKCPAHIKSYDGVFRMFEKSLSNMGLDYFNLYLINAPWPFNQKGKDFSKENLEVWRAFEELYLSERVSAIGVSNFEIEDLENIIKHKNIVPHVNQIEIHPGKSQDELRAYCKDKNIIIQAYSPLGHGNVLTHEKVIELAMKYNVSTAVLCLKFALQLDTYPIFKSSSLDHIKENMNLDFDIDLKDMEVLKNIELK